MLLTYGHSTINSGILKIWFLAKLILDFIIMFFKVPCIQPIEFCQVCSVSGSLVPSDCVQRSLLLHTHLNVQTSIACKNKSAWGIISRMTFPAKFPAVIRK